MPHDDHKDDIQSAKDFVANLVRKDVPRSIKQRSDGRRCALACIDILLSDAESIQHLYDAMAAEFAQRPIDFFRDVVMPTSKKIMEETDTPHDEEQVRVSVYLPDNGRDRRG